MRVDYALAAIAWSACVAAAEPGGITLVRDGMAVDLPTPSRAEFAARLPKLFATCSINSRKHPSVFPSSPPAKLWQDTVGKDHLSLRLSVPMELRTPDSAVFQVEEFVLGLGDSRFPGPELTRHGAEVVAYAKCSGHEVIMFVCAPGIRAAMPASYHDLCRYIKQRE